MKVYSCGAENAPVILLLPGTCCPEQWTALVKSIMEGKQ